MTMSKKPLVIMGGATGVGKTELSIKLAKAINGQIISADSMQVYKGFDIGTAKITPEEMAGVKHYMIDKLTADQNFNIYLFSELSKKYIEKIYSEGCIPIIVGGTGFYIQSLLYDIEFSEEDADKSYRQSLEEISKNGGNDKLYDMLKAVDPESCLNIHPNNIKRVIRALEYYHDTGRKISEHNEEQRAKVSQYNFSYFVLNRDRATVYKRIEDRVDIMVKQGLEAEVRALLDSGISPDCIPMNGLGYKEMKSFINGEISLDQAISDIKLNTRHFAKRQITWFKREPDAIWMNYEDFECSDYMLKTMINILKEKKIV